MKVSGQLFIARARDDVYEHLAHQVFQHAVEPASSTQDGTTILTRYQTRIGPLEIETMEEASLAPGEGITWRHKDGPLSPRSWETFRLEGDGDTTIAHYEGDIEPRNPLLKGPLTRLWVAPQTKRISMAALAKAKTELEA